MIIFVHLCGSMWYKPSVNVILQGIFQVVQRFLQALFRMCGTTGVPHQVLRILSGRARIVPYGKCPFLLYGD